MNGEPKTGNGLGQLTRAERDRLRVWQRRMTIGLVITLAFMVSIAIVDLTAGIPKALGWPILLVLLVLAASGGILQFSEKCPRCGFRIGLQSALVVPDTCRKCGVHLK